VLVDALKYVRQDIIIYFGGEIAKRTEKDPLKRIVKYFIGYDRKKYQAMQILESYPNAVILGQVNNINPILSEVCCLVSPFTKPHFARPVIEAFLNAKPVIASDVKGMDEIVSDGNNGFLYKADSARDLAEKINVLISQPSRAKLMGENALRQASIKFCEKNIKQFEALYDLLLK
jgi:glycosyltransferase involved in cell wall biosynthesis